MDNTTKADLELQSRTLRGELKKWENEWASANYGKKPGREDIKQNGEIAKKYKQYQQLRDTLAGKIPPPTSEAKSSPHKRKSTASHSFATPSKRTKRAETPRKNPVDIFDGPDTSPVIPRRLFSPALPTSIGPTPHRDGRVLGLFDLLSSGSSRAVDTPCRRGRTRDIAGLAAAVQGTPSRTRRGAVAGDEEGTPKRLRRTPPAGGRRIPDSFTTPMKKKDGNSAGGTGTPESASKMHFDTPACLRRIPLPGTDENGHDFGKSPPLRLPKKPLGRGLSAILANLRKIEEEALDEDLELLRELEAEKTGGILAFKQKPRSPPPKDHGGKESSPPSAEQGDGNGKAERGSGEEKAERRTTEEEILVRDSRVLLGGFDDEALYDSPEKEQLGRDGRPLKAYKKRGQKRTTRLSRMKPTVTKRPVVEGGDEAVPVPETQGVGAAGVAGGDDEAGPDQAEDSEFAGDSSEGEDKADGRKPKKSRKEGSSRTKPKAEAEAKTAEDGEKKVGVVRKAARKVNAMAHANFRRLKLRNSGAKGGPGYNSRFRRRK